MAQISGFNELKMEESAATGIRVPSASGQLRGVSGNGGLRFVDQTLVFVEVGIQIDQMVPFQGGFPKSQLSFFLSEFSQEPPLVETGKTGAGVSEFLLGKLQAESASQKVGDHKGSRPPDSVPAMDQNFFSQINGFIQPFQSLFRFLQ